MIPEELTAIMPDAGARANVYATPLTYGMAAFGIDTPKRQAAFLAQVAHESGQLRYVQEIASGAAYEGRIDLGNTQPGDGVRFKGRGLLQITGRSNYAKCSAALALDLLAHPELLETPDNASMSAGWFWSTNGLNRYADVDDFVGLTKHINGGLNGLRDRLQFWQRAKQVLEV